MVPGLFCALLLAVVVECRASSSIFYKEMNLLAGYSDLDEWVGEKPGAQNNSIGFEYFAKVSNDFGDFLTCDLQVRVGYDTDLSSDDAWGLEVHSAWVEYKLGLARNLRLGHFSPAFGLEPGVDTHGTLFQTLAGQDIGFKKDWGIEYRGSLGPFDYAVAAQTGSGMPVERKDGSYLATGRIGTPRGRNFEWGLSVLHGRVLRSMEVRTIPRPEIADQAVPKRRAGVDAQYLRGPFLFIGEATYGRNEDDNVIGALVQTDYTVPSLQSLTLNAQGRFWTDDPGECAGAAARVAVGGSFNILPSWTLRAGVFHDLKKPGNSEDTAVFLQVYFFGD
jgi:hypothetical protein